jgi:hypothetical protein
MSKPRLHAVPALFCALLLGAASAGAHATDYQLADGRVHFSAPDGWPQIMMQTSGNPQFMAFQVPDPSPVAQRVLARVTVTVVKMPDGSAFQQWVNQRVQHSHQLPGYESVAQPGSSSNVVRYTALESGVRMSYSERYFLKGLEGVQLRCLRPNRGAVDAAWVSSFDKGCDAIAASLQQGG